MLKGSKKKCETKGKEYILCLSQQLSKTIKYEILINYMAETKITVNIVRKQLTFGCECSCL